MVFCSLVLIGLCPIVLTPDLFYPLSFLFHPVVSVLFPLRIVLLNVLLASISFLDGLFLIGLSLSLNNISFMVKNVGNFLIIVVMLLRVLVLLPLLEGINLLNIGLGSLPLLASLHVLVVHIFGLFSFNHVKCMLFLHLFLPQFIFLLL